MLRPSRRGCCSIEPSSFTSSASLISRSRPRSGWSVSRPRNMIVTLTLARWPREAHDVPLLGLVVVDPDLRSELDLLDLNLELVLSGLLCALLLLVAVFRVVHDPRDGRVSAGRDLHEVEALAERVLQRFLRRRIPTCPPFSSTRRTRCVRISSLIRSSRLRGTCRSRSGRRRRGLKSPSSSSELLLLVNDTNRCRQRPVTSSNRLG